MGLMRQDHSKLKSLFSVLTGVAIGFVFAIISFHHDKVYELTPNFVISENLPTSKPEGLASNQNKTQNPNYYYEITEPQKPRVLCWVMTCPANHNEKAIYVKNTWGKRCDKLLFMSSATDEKLGAVDLKLNATKESRNILWGKTKKSFQYVWKHHREDADWFMKADDDTYVDVENLKAMLKDVDPKEPVFYAARFDWQGYKYGYMSGGPGYVLSKEALRRFIQDGLPDPSKCEPRDEYRNAVEDMEMAKCLSNVGVKPGDPRDAEGRYRFLPLPYDNYIREDAKQAVPWYWGRIHYPQETGPNCCSNTIVSFHNVSPAQMVLYDYLLYGVRNQTGIHSTA